LLFESLKIIVVVRKEMNQSEENWHFIPVLGTTPPLSSQMDRTYGTFVSATLPSPVINHRVIILIVPDGTLSIFFFHHHLKYKNL